MNTNEAVASEVTAPAASEIAAPAASEASAPATDQESVGVGPARPGGFPVATSADSAAAGVPWHATKLPDVESHRGCITAGECRSGRIPYKKYR